MDLLFWAIAVVAVLSGAAVFWVNSMARATYALALSFISVGVAVLLLHQDYVGVVTLLMMVTVMEMAVMAVHGDVHGHEPGLDVDEHGARQQTCPGRCGRILRTPRRRRRAGALAVAPRRRAHGDHGGA